MLDIKLFKLINNKTLELKEDNFDTEKSLQKLFEDNLEGLLNIYFLETEYSTGSFHGGRIDTLGLDANNNPVIIEYKKSYDYNVINQGLYYLEWLLDHTAEFKFIVESKLGKDKAEFVDFSNPRLLCISKDFNKFDYSAIQHINKNVELIKYKKYQDGVIYIEMIDPKNILKKPVKNLTQANKKQIEKTQKPEINDFERKKMKALHYIVKRGGSISRSEFTSGFRGVENTHERNDIIFDLINSGQLEMFIIESATKKKTGYRVVKT